MALMALGWRCWRAWFPVDAVVAAAVCVAGVALGDIDLHFAWQAWHLATWTCRFWLHTYLHKHVPSLLNITKQNITSKKIITLHYNT
jgi:hypothetical protein